MLVSSSHVKNMNENAPTVLIAIQQQVKQTTVNNSNVSFIITCEKYE